MRRSFVLALASAAALSCLAASPSTNAVPVVVSVASTTNAPAMKVTQRQCAAITKSGARCKRNAVQGRLCRQHQRIWHATQGAGVVFSRDE